MPSIYVAAHELKAPLVLMRQLVLELKQTQGGDAHIVERLLFSVERSLRLVEQLTKTSRLEDALFESEPLLPRTLCESVAHELEPFARATGQTIVTRVSRRSTMVVAHRSLLSALLVNLCDNALLHNPKGKKIVLSTRALENGLEFSVRDYGPSLSHGAFWALYSQLGNGPLPMGSRPRSSGLGLWIASQFAGAMNGTLSMTKHRSAGITVSVVLPYSKQLSLL